MRRCARTIARWEPEVLAHFTTGGASNGPTEAVNLLIKKSKPTGHGFHNFDNYRLRLPALRPHLTGSARCEAQGTPSPLGGVEPHYRGPR